MTDDIIAIILWSAVIFLLLLPPSLDPAIRIKMRQVLRGEHPESRKAEWLAWYKTPLTLRLSYLAKGGRHEPDWVYTSDRDKAFRFSTSELARMMLPVYDGSYGIKERTGVEIA